VYTFVGAAIMDKSFPDKLPYFRYNSVVSRLLIDTESNNTYTTCDRVYSATLTERMMAINNNLHGSRSVQLNC